MQGHWITARLAAGLAACLALGLAACQPAPEAPAATAPAAEPAAPAPTNDVAPAAAPSAWTLALDPLTLSAPDDGLTLVCEEAKKTLRLSFQPAWEKDGPFDIATVQLGDKSFAPAIDVAASADRSRPIYILPADADTVTAVMLANTLTLTVNNNDGEQQRSGPVDTDGVFDQFATTCAQINGLR
jgi:hypothetical protein